MEEQLANGQFPHDTPARYREARNAARARLRIINAHRGDGAGALSLMDVGAGNMAFVDIAQWFGFSRVEGIDPDPMREDCLTGTWRDVEGTWDVLSLWDVFEHLTRPRECLRYLRQCLSENGLLIIEMPELNAPCKDSWQKHIRPKQHLALYSKAAAEQLYEEEGFWVEEFHRPLQGTLGKMCFQLRKHHG